MANDDDDDEERKRREPAKKTSGYNGHFNSKFFVYRKYEINFRIVQENNNKNQHRMENMHKTIHF